MTAGRGAAVTAARLSVNVDHVATLRQARRATHPDPVEAALAAEAAGASGITVHLRADRRHIQDDDVARLARAIAGKLNLEMAPTEEMLAAAERLRPHQVSLVPERPDEVTTEGGLDVIGHGGRIEQAARRLAAVGVAVSIFLDPEAEQVDAVAALAERGVPIHGFEINTDLYTRAEGTDRDDELARCRAAAKRGARRGLEVYAGHGLTTGNVAPIAAIPEVEELNIGHHLVARAVIVGMAEAVREMLAAIDLGSTA
ncbi:MAG TPA: pyridoxine 5'-phosphate synthase [Thermoanaerobaculia bacterium]|nr:pyridoxine 5'-phosphate synthase [Thermoanaerobaculia bacterium]